jgi:hypothetical protein
MLVCIYVISYGENKIMHTKKSSVPTVRSSVSMSILPDLMTSILSSLDGEDEDEDDDTSTSEN